MQYAGLLQTFLRTFPTVYIHVSTEDEANILIEHDQNVSEVLGVIDVIRSAVRSANAAGRITFGPTRADAGENDLSPSHSSQNLLASLTEMPAAATPVGEMFEELAQKPTVENFLQFIQLVYAYGFPVEARDSVLGAIQSLRTEIATIPSKFAQAALDLAAFIAARNRDVELADRVVAIAIERLVATQDVDRLLPTVSVILECAAASSDRKDALATLARRKSRVRGIIGIAFRRVGQLPHSAVHKYGFGTSPSSSNRECAARSASDCGGLNR